MALSLPSIALLTHPLVDQSLAVIREYLPSPLPMLEAIDRRTPIPFKQLSVEAPLNRLFATAIEEGEFDDFEGRRIRLEVTGGQPGITKQKLYFQCVQLINLIFISYNNN
ncbi:hypothetical protein [Marinobacter alexandrii]|uniref:hypothetical protein n=1 Tax=Marinobacter alexandrii TaxID=2570351 RepID=UPI003299670E